MSLTRLLAQTCTIETLADSTVDSDRNFTRTITTTVRPCRLSFMSTSEPAEGGVGVVGRWQVFLPAGTVLTAASRIVVDGVRYRVDGSPNRVRGARLEHHVQAWLLEVSDVEGG